MLTIALCCVLIPLVAPVGIVESLAAGGAVVPVFAALGWAASVDARTPNLEGQRRFCCRAGNWIASLWLPALGFVAACQVYRIPGTLHAAAMIIVLVGGLAGSALGIRREHLEDEIRRRGRQT